MPNFAWKRPEVTALWLAGILLVAAGLRFHALGRPSLWYDEVVSMRLAEQPSVAGLLQTLGQIDATRAPLHPLILQTWIRVFGSSDYAGRALSAVCGVVAVALVFRIGRQLFDAPTALWGAWLAAISPLLVRYAQETRMYAWLVMLTCLAWDRLLAMRTRDAWLNVAAYALCQVALVYSHPLGLLMLLAQAVVYLAGRREFALGWPRWVASQAVVAIAILPWLGRYLDHSPEFVTGRLPVKFLLGLPIGFTGGNAWTLLVCGGLVVWGLLRRSATVAEEPAKDSSRSLAFDHPFAAVVLLTWLAVPPVLLYAYSWVGHPLFGSARYTLYVGPAYLLLLARGLVKLPALARYPLALAGAVLAGVLLETSVYAPDLKADWRAAAVVLSLSDRGPVDSIVVLSDDPNQPFEAETARYYIGSHLPVTPVGSALCDVDGLAARARTKWVVFSTGLRGGKPVAVVPAALREVSPIEGPSVDLPGLRLMWRKAGDEPTQGRSGAAAGGSS